MSLFSEIIKSYETNWELQVDYLFNQKRKLSLFSEIIKSYETNWELQVDYLFNQKRKLSKQKLNW